MINDCEMDQCGVAANPVPVMLRILLPAQSVKVTAAVRVPVAEGVK